MKGCRQVVRHKTLTLACVGSNPATPASSCHVWAGLKKSLTFLQNKCFGEPTFRRLDQGERGKVVDLIDSEKEIFPSIKSKSCHPANLIIMVR